MFACLAIDFGTSFTTAALRADDHSAIFEVDGSPRCPSAVFLTEEGTLLVGSAAEEEGVLASDRLERSPKRHLGRERILLGGQPVQVEDMVGAVLARVWEEAARRLGGSPPAQTVLTHPASWGERRRRALVAAAQRAGIGDPLLVPEPEAAAFYFADDQIGPGDHVAVYDLGGGTFDTAVLRRTDSGGFEMGGPPGGQEGLGGEAFDERLYRHLADSLATGEPELWHSLETSDDRAWRHARSELHRAARRAKERLSRESAAAVYVPQPVDRELRVTREELESLIQDDVESSLRILEQAVAAARVEPSQLSALYLTGGSSRIPLVANVVRERYGRVDTRDDPKSVVVLGALAAGAYEAEQPTEADVTAPLPMHETVTSPPPPPPGLDRSGAAAIPHTEPRPRGRRPAVVGLVLLGALLLAGVAVGAALALQGRNEPEPSPARATATPEESRFTAFAGTAGSAASSSDTEVRKKRNFEVGDEVELSFVDEAASSTDYRVCVSDPSGQEDCQSDRTAGPGTPSLLKTTPLEGGRYTASWYVGGSKVASWSYRAEPAPAPVQTDQSTCPEGTVSGPSGCEEQDTPSEPTTPDCPEGQIPAQTGAYGDCAPDPATLDKEPTGKEGVEEGCPSTPGVDINDPACRGGE